MCNWWDKLYGHDATVFHRCGRNEVNMNSKVWVFKRTGCRVVSHNAGMLITHGKWEINVISSHNSAGSDWNGHSICKLNVNGIGRGNRGRSSWHGGRVSGYTHCRNICVGCHIIV